ncbi:DUF2651 family protein [Bacillus sp. T3]|uniref:DUF2651 family protein n=1 Tax=Bacillus sp. T3 TaxID=467262 RepID=UPI0029828E2C|nr:DUF2651 family protein [Bacillus sp. T3]
MDKHLKFININRRYFLYFISLFVILCIAFLLQGIRQGGDFDIYGEDLAFGLFIYPLIVLVISIIGSIKNSWYVMPCITLIVLLVFFPIVTNDTYIVLLLAYLFISLIGSILTRLINHK